MIIKGHIFYCTFFPYYCVGTIEHKQVKRILIYSKYTVNPNMNYKTTYSSVGAKVSFR